LPTTADLKQQLQSSNKYEVMRARLLLEQIEAGKPLSPSYNYPIQTWQFASGPEWVHLGGEVVVDFSLRINAERKNKETWVTSYANDVMAYIPSERVLREGGYEGATSMIYYGLPTVWAEGVEQTIMDEVNRQLDQ
jgi:neutral ceramidase